MKNISQKIESCIPKNLSNYVIVCDEFDEQNEEDRKIGQIILLDYAKDESRLFENITLRSYLDEYIYIDNNGKKRQFFACEKDAFIDLIKNHPKFKELINQTNKLFDFSKEEFLSLLSFVFDSDPFDGKKECDKYILAKEYESELMSKRRSVFYDNILYGIRDKILELGYDNFNYKTNEKLRKEIIIAIDLLTELSFKSDNDEEIKIINGAIKVLEAALTEEKLTEVSLIDIKCFVDKDVEKVKRHDLVDNIPKKIADSFEKALKYRYKLSDVVNYILYSTYKPTLEESTDVVFEFVNLFKEFINDNGRPYTKDEVRDYLTSLCNGTFACIDGIIVEYDPSLEEKNISNTKGNKVLKLSKNI